MAAARKLLAVLLLLTSCAKSVKTEPPSPVSDLGAAGLQLMEHEATTCERITAHDSPDEPECQRVYAAWLRGKQRVEAVYPEAANIKMGMVDFLKPQTESSPSGKPYPVIRGFDVRGFMSVLGGPPLIAYSYEEVIEHETVHALGFLVGAATYRNFCHGTPDDPFGESGNVSSCIQRRNEEY